MSNWGLSRLLVIALSISFFPSCASWIKKPEINGVKKVAIVSLYADEMVPWTGGRGRIKRWSSKVKNKVASDAYKAWRREFKKLGWRAISHKTVAKNKVYKKEFGPQQAGKDDNILAKGAKALGELKNSRYFTRKGLFPIAWRTKKDQEAGMSFNLANMSLEGRKDFKGQLSDLAKDLGVDAVALIYLDYCYTGAAAVLGNGTAKMLAGSYVKMVNTDKDLIVDMKPNPDRCESDHQGESNRTVAMVGGSIALGKTFAADTLVKAFREATVQNAKQVVALMKKEIDDK